MSDRVRMVVDDVSLEGTLHVPAAAHGLVVFVHGSGSSRHSPRNIAVAEGLQRAGFATLLFDLLTEAEAADRVNVFDIDLLASRVTAVVQWLRQEPRVATLPIGLFGASTGAAAALVAATTPGMDIAAVVSRGGRPDLAAPVLAKVTSPTLLIVGSLDIDVLDLNRQALAMLRCEAECIEIPGATHLFEEPGTLAAAAEVATSWFTDHL